MIDLKLGLSLAINLVRLKELFLQSPLSHTYFQAFNYQLLTSGEISHLPPLKS
jgi:hypothetical protein